jgi:hypothetical protein
VTVSGLLADGPVTVVAVTWHGSTAVSLTYPMTRATSITAWSTGSRDRRSLSSCRQARWTFDADPALFRLVSEARRIQLAYLFNPMLALHQSQLDTYPHQLQAVYGELLPRQPLRFAPCDDPGAGKTIMAALYIKELALRSDLARCLVVAPGAWPETQSDLRKYLAVVLVVSGGFP